VDADFGPFFLKFASYFPYTAKLCLNGHHWAQRQAAKAGLDFVALDNGFAWCEDQAALQAICDRLDAVAIDDLLRKWLAKLPHPFTADDRQAGYRYDISILQAEFSTTQVLDRPLTGRVFLPAGDRRQPRLGPSGPGRAGLRPQGAHQRTPADPGRFPHPSDHRWRHAVAAYRLQTFQNQAVSQTGPRAAHRDYDQRHPRLRDRQRLHNLPALRQVGFQANRRLLDVQRISHEPWIGEDALDQVICPVVADGQRAPALRLGDRRVLALLSALVVFRLLTARFSNADLRAHLAPLLGLEPGALTQGRMTYDLRRLRLHGLIERIPGTHRYRVTELGLRAALFLTRLHNRLIRPGLAQTCGHDPPAPSRLRRAFSLLQTEMDRFAQQSHLAA
jgi:hypothetical protein